MFAKTDYKLIPWTRDYNFGWAVTMRIIKSQKDFARYVLIKV